MYFFSEMKNLLWWQQRILFVWRSLFNSYILLTKWDFKRPVEKKKEAVDRIWRLRICLLETVPGAKSWYESKWGERQFATTLWYFTVEKFSELRPGEGYLSTWFFILWTLWSVRWVRFLFCWLLESLELKVWPMQSTHNGTLWYVCTLY